MRILPALLGCVSMTAAGLAVAQTGPLPAPAAPSTTPAPAPAAAASSPSAGAGSYPALPDPPKLATSAYPTCQDHWQTGTSRFVKFSMLQTCVNELERFNDFNFRRFPLDVAQYSTKLVLIEKQFARSAAPQADKQSFHDHVLDLLSRARSRKGGADDQDYGDDYRDYYQYLQRYQDDMKELQRVRELCRDSVGGC